MFKPWIEIQDDTISIVYCLNKEGCKARHFYNDEINILSFRVRLYLLFALAMIFYRVHAFWTEACQACHRS